MQVFIINNAGFCYQNKEKLLSSKTFGRMQISIRKDKNEKSDWCDLEKSLSDESDNCTNDESNE